MKDVSIGIIFTPLTAEDWDLKEISAEITRKGEFEEIHSPDNYYVWLLSIEGRTEVGVYFDGMVYYIKKVREEDVTPTQMLDIVKEGFDFIQNSTLDKEYLRRIGLVIRGKQMKGFYAEKERVIEEFGKRLFAKPLIGEAEITDSDIQMSIREMPLLSFTSS
ncbi:MAG TPA: hypothetical protein G4O17_01540 [Dehalococcoidia bacterium]|jgi:hypothetical protein|nr:hypothetical protein [Dehalococcoidia bacterium]